MDFEDNAEEAAFRRDARGWLLANAPDLPRSHRRRLPTPDWLAHARARQATNAGGADEILKTILAERVLGLPPEPRSDRTTAFKNLPGPTG